MKINGPEGLRGVEGQPFAVPPETLQWKGKGLRRPECVLATAGGDLFASDSRGGVAHIRPDGSQAIYTGSLPGGRPLHPNGIALRRTGTFLLADLGESQGGVFELSRDGSVRPFLEEVDGVELPPTNFVAEDHLGRIWVTVSTRLHPRTRAFRPDIADGFIVLKDERGARVVADNLGFTNEAILSPDGTWLYVNETFSRRLSRFRIATDGSLGTRETVTTFGKGTFPDGLAFDGEGGVWITSIVSNRVIRVAPDGSQQLILEDVDEAHVEWSEQAFIMGALGRTHVDVNGGRFLKNISSIAFGGADLRTAYLGCLKGDSIASFQSPVAGHPPAHWHY
jgi:sugar lactone lactonase YvrE